MNEMQNGPFILYGLFDPRGWELRYVGKSSSGVRQPNIHAVLSGRYRQTGGYQFWYVEQGDE
jgi:hypothetical protein